MTILHNVSPFCCLSCVIQVVPSAPILARYAHKGRSLLEAAPTAAPHVASASPAPRARQTSKTALRSMHAQLGQSTETAPTKHLHCLTACAKQATAAAQAPAPVTCARLPHSLMVAAWRAASHVPLALRAETVPEAWMIASQWLRLAPSGSMHQRVLSPRLSAAAITASVVGAPDKFAASSPLRMCTCKN